MSCNICGSDEEIVTPDICKHEYCFKCIKEWWEISPKCPLCIREFDKIIKDNIVIDMEQDIIDIMKEHEYNLSEYDEESIEENSSDDESETRKEKKYIEENERFERYLEMSLEEIREKNSLAFECSIDGSVVFLMWLIKNFDFNTGDLLKIDYRQIAECHLFNIMKILDKKYVLSRDMIRHERMIYEAYHHGNLEVLLWLRYKFDILLPNRYSDHKFLNIAIKRSLNGDYSFRKILQTNYGRTLTVGNLDQMVKNVTT